MFWSTSRSLAESTAMHSHEVAELILCRAGTGLLALDDRQLELAPRRSVLIAANVPHRFIFHEGEHTDLKFICVTNSDAALYLAPAQCSILQGAGKQGATGLAYTGSRQWLWELAEKIPESFGLDEPNELMELWGIIGLLIGAHAQAARAGADETTRGGGRHAETIRRICGWSGCPVWPLPQFADAGIQNAYTHKRRRLCQNQTHPESRGAAGSLRQ